MNSPRRHEMDKLQTIQRQTEAVQQRLDERLPQQRRNLAAFVSFYKWRLQTQHSQSPQLYTQELVDATAKKLRVEVGAFEYVAKEQSEVLTRSLFQLDDILSNGDAEIKDTRKALVLEIQKLLEQADALNAKATSLKQFTESVISRLPIVPVADVLMEETTEAAQQTSTESSTETAQMEEDEDDWEHVNASDIQPLFHEEDEEIDANEEKTETPNEDVSAPGQQQAAAMEVEEPTTAPAGTTDAQEEGQEDEEEDEEEEDEPEGVSIGVSSLPVWRPYYQIQKRADGIYLVANLRGVDPRYVRVEAMPQNGVLRISGFKLPTQKDLLLSRLSGAPTFGRFDIVERFPTQTLSLENASQQLTRDGTLQVRLPFYFVQHPRILRRVSPFQPHRLMVW